MPRAESAAPLGTPVLRSPLLSALKELAASRTLRLEPDVPLRVAVVAVERYLAPHAGAGPLGPGDSYAYDLTVTDGISRVKCHLRPGLNRLVHTLSLRSGAEVRVSRLSLVHDERRLHQSFVRVEDLECCPGGESAVLSSVGSLAALLVWPADDAGNSASLQPDGPLRLGRKHYLSLWNNEDAYGPIWSPGASPVVVADASKICLLSDLEAFFARSKRPFPLLVRVMHKSRLRYYGKPNLAIDFPYQAYFEVADQSGTMSMVLWNDLCLKWYQRLTVGAVLYLEQYSLKSSYQHRSRPQVSAHLVAFHSTEICLNPHSPTAVLSIVPPQNVKPQWRLPDVTYRFTPRTEVEHLSSNQTVDVIGLVTFVGRVERVRNRGNTIPEKYWTYRWVHALDGTSDSPFILEIFASSQPEVFDSICPMTYLVCTQMRVCREPGSALYLTSSAETQIFTTGHHRKQPYLSDPQVKAFIQWTKTLKDKLMLRRTAVGGYYCYPPPPPSFTPSTDGESGQTQLVALDDLKVELESLQYREHKRLAIQGHITAVRYHPWPGQTTEPSQADQSVSFVPDLVVPGLEDRDTVSTDSIQSLKRKRRKPTKRQMKCHYMTRLQVRPESEIQEEDSGESEAEEEPDCHGLPNEIRPAEPADKEPGAHAEDGPSSSTRRSADPASALWESSMWPLIRSGVSEHLSTTALQQESMAESFSYDDRELLCQKFNLHPAKWNPGERLVQDPFPTPVDHNGHYTLTILSLNQKTAVDALFLPILSVKNPRAAGMSWCFHDNSLLSCLASGHLCPPPNSDQPIEMTYPPPDEVMLSAADLEGERVVCVLDLCLLGQDRVEMICSKIYKTKDIITQGNSIE